MTELYASGQKLDLPPSVSLQLFRSYSWLFEQKEGDYSFTFQLNYTPTNNKVFNWANDGIMATVNINLDATLKLFGYTYKVGTLVLNKCNRTGYECVFKAGRSDIDVSQYLHEVVDNEVTISDTSYAWLRTFITPPTDFCFPHLARNEAFYNYFLEFPYGTFDPISNPTAGNYATDCPISPCISFRAILYNLIQQSGYTPVFASNDQLSQLYSVVFVTGTDIRDSNITGARIPANSSVSLGTLPSSFNYKDHLPWITIGDFLRGLYYHLGVMVLFDSIRNEANVINFASAFSEELDITEYVEPDPEVDFVQDAGVTLAFKIDDKDMILADEINNLDNFVDKLTEEADYTDTISFFTAMTSNQDWACLNRAENKWYGKKFISSSIYNPIGTARYPFKIGSGAISIEIPWQPVTTDNYILMTLAGVTLRDNGSGYVRLVWATPIGTNGNIVNAGKVKLTGSQEYSDNVFFDISTINGAQSIDLDLVYTVDEDLSEVVAQATRNIEYNGTLLYKYNLMPTIQQEPGTLKKDDVPRVAIFWGLGDDPDAVSRYPYASAFNYDATGAQMGDFALRLYGEELGDSATRFFHPHMFDIYADYRLFTWYAHLPAQLLEMLNNLKSTIRIRGTKYLLIEKDETINQNGTEGAQELQLLKVK